MTVWPPQTTVARVTRHRPGARRPTTTGVPFEASAALIPPPLFSAIDVIDGGVGATVSTVTGVADELTLALPAASVSLAVTLTVPWPCAVIVDEGAVTVALLPEMSPPGACS